MTGTPSPETVSTKRQRIAELARNAPDNHGHLREFLKRRVRASSARSLASGAAK